MSDYEVGRGKPPKHTQFKPGNQAARKRKQTKKVPTMRQLLNEVLSESFNIKRGNEIVRMMGADVLKQRFRQLITSNSARDLAIFMSLLDKHGANVIAAEANEMTVTYHRADNSRVELPSAKLWEADK